MKVLFAVNNESVSESIVKKYQKEYKEIISYKNVYYFNAISKELQKDKTYDRVVISEDLEQFTNSSYEQMDKFIFERLDSISDEATNTQGNDIPIILICTDRRSKGEQILVKLFGISIYNAIIGADRSVEEVCRLIYKPRIKKEAKLYYRIDVDDVSYQAENENDVSEVEIQNILAHYKRLGRQEERYVESFNNIAEQYNDKQLRIICKFLPLNVKAVLEEQSEKYQKVMSFNTPVSNSIRKDEKKEKKEKGITGKMLTSDSKNVLTKPVIIPSNMNAGNVNRLTRSKKQENNVVQTNEQVNSQSQFQIQDSTKNETPNNYTMQNQLNNVSKMNDFDNFIEQELNEIIEENNIDTPKKGRGRPKKNNITDQDMTQTPKRGRGRPKKNQQSEIEKSTIQNQPYNTLPGFDDDSNNNDNYINNFSNGLPKFEDDEDNDIEENNNYNNYNTNNYNTQSDGFNTLPGFDDEEDDDDIEENNNYNNYNTNSYNTQSNKFNTLPGFDDEEDDDIEENHNYNNYNTNSYNTQDNKFNTLPGFDDDEEDDNDIEESDNYNNYNTNSYNTQNDNFNTLPGFENTKYDEQEKNYNNVNRYSSVNKTYNDLNSFSNNQNKNSYSDNYITESNVSSLLTVDKKLISVVGTTKNGTSFVINNVAQQLSSMGINTAILDTTANRNSYYIYTKNEEELRKVATSSLESLVEGVSNGIKINSNLTVYTSLPDQNNTIKNSGPILETLVKNHSIVLVDCDFETPYEYFKEAQEIYLVQSMDVLTIQPLTAFLRDLKAKNVLDENKIRIIINKFTRVRSVTEKTIIGGMAFYNDPAMSFMTELFDRNSVKYVVLPFEEDTYVRYLEGLVNCEITLKGYSKTFLQYLKQVANMMYPVISGKGSYKPNNSQNYNSNGFSSSMNNTLNQMKRNY